jgi:hypothetical protein
MRRQQHAHRDHRGTYEPRRAPKRTLMAQASLRMAKPATSPARVFPKYPGIHGQPDILTLNGVGGCCSINRTAPPTVDKSNGGTDAEGETLARG